MVCSTVFDSPMRQAETHVSSNTALPTVPAYNSQGEHRVDHTTQCCPDGVPRTRHGSWRVASRRKRCLAQRTRRATHCRLRQPDGSTTRRRGTSAAACRSRRRGPPRSQRRRVRAACRGPSAALRAQQGSRARLCLQVSGQSLPNQRTGQMLGLKHGLLSPALVTSSRSTFSVFLALPWSLFA